LAAAGLVAGAFFAAAVGVSPFFAFVVSFELAITLH
jgi:hypothetical protein